MERLIFNSIETIERPTDVHKSNEQDERWIVVVHNNDHNTYEEVIMILMIATHCTLEEAEIETWEIDHLGKSVVHVSDQEECEEVARIVRQIGIQVEVLAD